MLFSKSVFRFIQISMLIITLLIIPLSIPLLISVIVVFLLIACAMVDLTHSIYLKFKKVCELDKLFLVIDFLSLLLGIAVIYLMLILITFHGIKMSN
jgi:hypothetical protein